MPTQDSLVHWKNVERHTMHHFQRKDFVEKNLLGKTYTFQFAIYDINIDHFFVYIGPDENSVRIRFDYDTSLNSKVHILKKGDIVNCSGKLLSEGDLSDYGFRLQLIEITKVDTVQNLNVRLSEIRQEHKTERTIKWSLIGLFSSLLAIIFFSLTGYWWVLGLVATIFAIGSFMTAGSDV